MQKVLTEIGADTTKQILVLNKADKMPEPARVGPQPAVTVSALTGAGIPELLQMIDTELVQDPVGRHRFRFPLAEGRALHLLHDRAAVISKRYGDEWCEIVADVPESIRQRLAEFAIE